MRRSWARESESGGFWVCGGCDCWSDGLSLGLLGLFGMSRGDAGGGGAGAEGTGGVGAWGVWLRWRGGRLDGGGGGASGTAGRLEVVSFSVRVLSLTSVGVSASGAAGPSLGFVPAAAAAEARGAHREFILARGRG